MAEGGAISLRIALKGAEEVKAKLREIGPEGGRMARDMDRAMRQPSASLSALDGAISGARGQLTAFAGPLGNLGPVGIAAGAGIAAAGLAAAALAASFRGSATWAANLTDAADRIGVGTEALQELRYAADETGVPVETLEASLQKLNGSLGAMQNKLGEGKVKGAFAALGIGAEDLKGLNTAADLLPLLADRLSKVEGQAARVQLLKKLGIEELEPLLRRGAAGLNEMTAEGRNLVGVGGDLVSSLDEADRALERNQQQIDANVRKMQASLAPFFRWLSDMTTKAVTGLVNLLSFSESERLQSVIDRRASMERGLREQGRTTFRSSREQGQYDALGREGQAILDARARRAAEAKAAADAAGAAGGGNGGSSGGGGGGEGRRISQAQRDAEDAQRRIDRVNDAIYRERQEQLRAAEAATVDLVSRQKLESDRLNLQQAHEREEKAQLIAEGAITDAKKVELQTALATRQAQEVEALSMRQRQEREAALAAAAKVHQDIQTQILSAASATAQTAGERRAIEHQLLAISQETMRADLLSQIAAAETAEARAELKGAFNGLAKLFAAQSGEIDVRYAGPVESWWSSQASLPASQEWMQGEALDALDGLNAGLIEAYKNIQNAGDAFDAMGDVALAALQKVADGLLSIALQRMLIQPLASALFGDDKGGSGLLSGFLNQAVGMAFAGSTASVTATGQKAAAGVVGSSGLQLIGNKAPDVVPLPLGAFLQDTDRNQRTILDALRVNAHGARAEQGATQLNVKIINQTGQPVQARERMGQDGPEVILEAMRGVVRGEVAQMGADGALQRASALRKPPKRR